MFDPVILDESTMTRRLDKNPGKYKCVITGDGKKGDGKKGDGKKKPKEGGDAS